jgi:HSP20 family molecular chaperone IbpA
MMSLINSKKNQFYKSTEGTYDDYSNRSLSTQRLNTSDVKITETKSSFHFKLKIPGYIKEDFNFYISNDDLVVTTEKRKIKETYNMGNDAKHRHSYCYPSAFFKRKFPLPEHIARDEIFVDYKDEVLSFELQKQDYRKDAS